MLGTSDELPYALPEDDYHWEWSKEGRVGIKRDCRENLI